MQVSPWHRANASDAFFGRYQRSLNRLKDAKRIQWWDFNFEIIQHIQPWYWSCFPCQDKPVETCKVLEQLGYIEQHSYVMSRHFTSWCVSYVLQFFHLHFVTCVIDRVIHTLYHDKIQEWIRCEGHEYIEAHASGLVFTSVADTDTCKFDVALLGYVVQSACGCRMCRKGQQMECQHLQQRDCICWISFCTLELLQSCCSAMYEDQFDSFLLAININGLLNILMGFGSSWTWFAFARLLSLELQAIIWFIPKLNIALWLVSLHQLQCYGWPTSWRTYTLTITNQDSQYVGFVALLLNVHSAVRSMLICTCTVMGHAGQSLASC